MTVHELKINHPLRNEHLVMKARAEVHARPKAHYLLSAARCRPEAYTNPKVITGLGPSPYGRREVDSVPFIMNHLSGADGFDKALTQEMGGRSFEGSFEDTVFEIFLGNLARPGVAR